MNRNQSLGNNRSINLFTTWPAGESVDPGGPGVNVAIGSDVGSEFLRLVLEVDGPDLEDLAASSTTRSFEVEKYVVVLRLSHDKAEKKWFRSFNQVAIL